MKHVPKIVQWAEKERELNKLVGNITKDLIAKFNAISKFQGSVVRLTHWGPKSRPGMFQVYFEIMKDPYINKELYSTDGGAIIYLSNNFYYEVESTLKTILRGKNLNVDVKINWSGKVGHIPFSPFYKKG